MTNISQDLLHSYSICLVVDTAEQFNAARGGWGNPPPRYAPAGTVADNVRSPHMLVADCAPLTSWFNRKLEKP